MSPTPEESEPPQPAQDETDWPTHCEHCGTELETAAVAGVPDADSEHLQTAPPAGVVRQDYCPNPDCPAKS